MKIISTYLLLWVLTCISTSDAQTFIPTRKVVIENQTICATGFGIYCPRGIVYLDSFARSAYANMAEVINVHSSYQGPPNDSMENFAYWNACSNNPHLTTYAWPQIMVDRKGVTNIDSVFNYYNMYTGEFGVADIIVSPAYIKATGSLYVTTYIRFAIDVLPTTTHYDLALVLTEDSVHGTSINYSQRNAYSGGGLGPLAGGGIDFTAQPDPVPASLMYYRNVARAILPSFSGQAGSLPDTLHADSTYSYPFPLYTVPANYNASKMRAIVLLIDRTNGKIMNANGAFFSDSVTAVPEILNGMSSFSVFPNPFSDETSLKITLSTSDHVSIEVSDIIGQNVSVINMGLLSAGEHSLTLNAKDMTPAVYFVTLKTGIGSLTKRIVLNK